MPLTTRSWCSALLTLACAVLVAAPLTAAKEKAKRTPPGHGQLTNGGSHDHGGGHGGPTDDGAGAEGCSVTLAGPASVVRKPGKPRVEKFPFHSPDPGAPHFLRIDNGGANAARRPVTSAWVELNGRVVLGPHRFNGFVREIEQQVDVEEENLLAILVAGKPRSGFDFEVFAIDAQAPRLLDVSPPSGSVVSEPQVTLVIAAEDALAGVTSVLCAGLEATSVADAFACTVPLVEGSNPIELVATDGCGNRSSETIVIVFDPPPVVAITAPDDGDVFVLGPIRVTGTVDDPTASVSVNGVPAVGAPFFSALVPVRKGPNTLEAVARDAAGGEGRDSVEVTVLAGASGPTVTLSSPEPGFLLGGPRATPPAPTPVAVRGRIRAEGGTASAPSVVVNGVAAAVAASGAAGPLCSVFGVCDWNFSASLLLAKADNPQLIEAVGTDRFGETDLDSVTGNIDECVTGDADDFAVVDRARGQSNRCHKIDGCSAPFPDSIRQDPTAGTLGRRSTAFGKDTSATDFDPHGLAPRDDLPCNHHDVCYQTCGADKVDCDNAMFRDMRAVCRAAYPESTCPYFPNVLVCDRWRFERDGCYAWARRYRAGLSADQWVDDRFGQRQDEYCRP